MLIIFLKIVDFKDFMSRLKFKTMNCFKISGDGKVVLSSNFQDEDKILQFLNFLELIYSLSVQNTL